jgi:hypothetical protein
MATGHAAGVIAAMSSRADIVPRKLQAKDVQAALTAQGAILFHPPDPA